MYNHSIVLHKHQIHTHTQNKIHKHCKSNLFIKEFQQINKIKKRLFSLFHY